jgi:D-alanyl-lipoteichoic acid acyltransferase DltB (MBOAT superfamily)
MLFNSLSYLIFLPVTVILYWLLPFKLRIPLLIIASYVFYMSWKPIYGLLLLALTVINFGFGLAIHKSESRKRMFLVLALVANLATLAYFKYTYFLRDTANSALSLFGAGAPQVPPIAWEILLPLGISFFVFEFIHYLVDVYGGHQPVRKFLDFALFASFFPTQLAGPIKRYQDFVQQLASPRKITADDFDEAIDLIMIGLFKKVVLADNIALVVNRTFGNYQLLNGADMWLAAWAFAFQAYYDFSGYTDIARGSALLFGYRVPINFNLPYMADSIADFWRRWHISLSLWLRDYVFIPLGGNKKGPWLNCLNLFITMTLAGLWHGAADHFVFFGVVIGVMLVIHRLWRTVVGKSAWLTKAVETRVFHAFAICLTFNSFIFALASFRCQTVPIGMEVWSKMLFLPEFFTCTLPHLPTILRTTESPLFQILPFLLVGCYIAHAGMYFIGRRDGRDESTQQAVPLPRFLKPAYLAALAILLILFSPQVTPQFIYYQF